MRIESPTIFRMVRLRCKIPVPESTVCPLTIISDSPGVVRLSMRYFGELYFVHTGTVPASIHPCPVEINGTRNAKSQSEDVVVRRADSLPALSVGLLSSTFSYSTQSFPCSHGSLKFRRCAIFWRCSRLPDLRSNLVSSGVPGSVGAAADCPCVIAASASIQANDVLVDILID